MAASWECPSLPMIHLPMKDSSKVTFLALKPMIAAHYEEEPESFNEEIRQLDQLRELALRPSRDYNGCSVLRRYFAQLHLLRARFPPETIGHLPIDFVWKDVYTNAEYIQEGLQIEQASVLYNICCLHSILATRGRRDTEQEMKEAIAHFQCAAGAYAYLDERFATSHASKDLGPEFVTFYKNLMLGQAQECFVEKSLKGVGRVKNNTVAKLAARVSEYYSQCCRPLEHEPCNIIAKKNKDWPKLLKMKALYFQAISHFYQGAHSEEIGKHGEAIAWYQFAQQKVGSIGKLPKSLGEAARDAVKNFNTHVHEKLQTVKRQNDQVYHDPVPDIEMLDATQGADLVKPVAFHATDPKNLGTDIFGRLVPMGAYEAASVFSEEKAKLLRSVVSSVTEKDEELDQYLVSLNAGEIDKLKQDAPSLPESVLEQHKQMQGKSMMVKKLHSDLQTLMELSGKVTKDLEDISEKKKEEVEGEEAFQGKFGKRTPSQVCAALWKDAGNYQTYHNQASKSNSELKSMFDQHYQYLLLLSGPLASLQATVPKMTPMDAPEEDAVDSERWEELMGKIDKMRQQRRMLIGQLREQINSDDITKTMVGHLGSDKDVFISDHMKRHRELADIIRQNLTAQDNILLAVTDVNARQVKVRQAAQELTQQQEKMFAALTKAGGFYSVLQTKIGEGLSFYTRLHDNVSKLRNRVLEVVATRTRERESVQRQRSPSPSPPPGPAPPRPPKKAELAGKPLPQGQTESLPPSAAEQPPPSSLPAMATPSVPPQPAAMATPSIPPQPAAMATPSVPPQPAAIAMTSVLPPSSSSSSFEDQLHELQRRQQLQLQQLTSPTSVEHPSEHVGVASQPPPAVLSPTGGPAHDVGSPTATSRVPLAPDANQALLDLQMLLQPPEDDLAKLAVPIQPVILDQPDDHADSAYQPHPPQRPPKPANLQSQAVAPPISPPTLPAGPAQTEGGDLSTGLAVEGIGGGGGVAEYGGGQPDQASIMGGGMDINQLAVGGGEPILTPVMDGTVQPVMGGEGTVQPVMGAQSEEGAEPLQGGQIEGVHQPFEEDRHTVEGVQPTIEGEQRQIPIEGIQHFVEGVEHPVEGVEQQQIPTEGEQQAIVMSTFSQPIFVPPPVGMAAPQTDSTLTTNSISRPIPAPIQSPPPPMSPDHTPPPPPPPGTSLPISPPPTTAVEIPPPSSVPPTITAAPGGSTDVPYAQEQPPATPTSLPQATPTSLAVSKEAIVPQTSLYPLQSITAHEAPSVSAANLYESSMASHAMANLHSLPPHRPPPPPPPSDQPSVHTSTNASSLQSSEFILSHGIDTNLHGLPQHSMMSQPLPPLTSSVRHTLDLDTRLAKMEVLLQQQKESINEKTREVEEGRAQMADQKRQLDNYKQQVALLHQQLSQVTAQQQKQEQEKVTVSGQQAVLMQLLQQQQGMFSQQQAQLEALSKASEDHHKQLQESEVKYRQALAVEQEQKSNLQNQVLQLNQEIQRLNHQLQGQSQQQQTAQMQVYQFHTQIQERDKQLIAFRDQHKEIVQKLEQKHQEKVTQLIQQIQELQMSLKKSREQQRSIPPGGLAPPIQPTRVSGPQLQQQYQQPAPQTPRQPQPSPQQPMTQPLPQQQPGMSPGMSVPGTPTSVPGQSVGVAHSAHPPGPPPTSTSWPPVSQGMPRQASQVYTGPIPGQSHTQQHMQPSQTMAQSPGMVAPGNRPMMTSSSSHPIVQPGQVTGAQGQFPPTTGVMGYPAQFVPPGQQPMQQRPPQTQYPNFNPGGPQFPGQQR